jgi:hypothetical protein
MKLSRADETNGNKKKENKIGSFEVKHDNFIQK